MVIFVGDSPSSLMRPGAKAFKGAACESRLKEWIQYLEADKCTIINRTSFEFTWYLEYQKRFNDPLNKFIALGNNASKALSGIDHFKLPHPSGQNRQINDKEFIAKQLKSCKDWIHNDTTR